jgi:hypothetical protein
MHAGKSREWRMENRKWKVKVESGWNDEGQRRRMKMDRGE